MNHLKKFLVVGAIALALPAGTALALLDDPNSPDDCPPNTLCAEDATDASTSTTSTTSSTSSKSSQGFVMPVVLFVERYGNTETFVGIKLQGQW